MKLRELLQKLGKYADLDTCIYLNYEQNWEDEFKIVLADTGNLLLVPSAKFEELKNSQEFYFVEG